MKPIQIVHTADLHLGSSFSLFSDQAAVLQTEQLETFLAIVDLCRRRQADLLLIAGDLFESAQPPARLVEEVRAMLATIPGTDVIITPGNHDPAGPGSPWQPSAWPDHVHVFDQGLQSLELPRLQTRIYGAAFRSTAAPSPLIESLDPSPDLNLINILILHADLVSSGQASVYNPLSREWLAGSGLDYVALGHVHQGHLPERLGSQGPCYAYAGCPAGRGFDEQQARGVLCGSLKPVLQPSGRRSFRIECEMTFCPVSKRRFRQMSVDISACRDQQAIRAAIEQNLQLQPEGWAGDAWKIILTGSRPADFQPSLVLLQSGLKELVFYLRIVDRTVPEVKIEQLSREHSLAGAFVRQILAGREAAWESLPEEEQQLIRIGLQAFDEEVPYREDP